MRSDTLRPAIAAGLCVAALGFGAATLSNAVVVSSKPNVAPGSSIDLPWSTSATYVGVVAAVALVAVGIYLLGGRGVGSKREFLKAIPLLAGIILLIVVVNHLLFTAIEPPAGFDMAGANASGGGGGGGGNNSSASGGGPVEPGGGNFFASLGLLAALLVGLIAVVGAEYIPDRGDDAPAREAVESEEDDDEAIGEAAGRAADRIEAADDGDENEVYRAWREMADSVDVSSPRTSTPAEFAAAAVDAGLDRERVEELTDLFEAVRYGDRDVTEERERRAVAALREIEREHGGDGA